jgi:hypothetical protein
VNKRRDRLAQEGLVHEVGVVKAINEGHRSNPKKFLSMPGDSTLPIVNLAL